MIYGCLRPNQINSVLRMERESFEQMCNKAGVDIRKQEAFMLEVLKDAIRTHPNDETNSNILKCGDYFQALRLLAYSNKQNDIRVITNIWDKLPINRKYWERTIGNLKKMGYEIEETPYDSLMAIPHYCLFDSEFNAFVRRSVMLDNVPLLCIYELLTNMTYELLNFIVPVIFRLLPSGKCTFSPESFVAEKASTNNFMNNCGQYFEGLFGYRSADMFLTDVDLVTSNPNPNVMLYYLTLINAGAHFFVLSHEYGHLLMGHLDLSQCPQIEHDADQFAYRVLSDGFRNINDNLKMMLHLGAAFLLILLCIFEKKQGGRVSETHPPSIIRLILFHEVFANKEYKEVVAAFVRLILAAVNPTLKFNWNFEVVI